MKSDIRKIARYSSWCHVALLPRTQCTPPHSPLIIFAIINGSRDVIALICFPFISRISKRSPTGQSQHISSFAPPSPPFITSFVGRVCEKGRTHAGRNLQGKPSDAAAERTHSFTSHRLKQFHIAGYTALLAHVPNLRGLFRIHAGPPKPTYVIYRVCPADDMTRRTQKTVYPRPRRFKIGSGRAEAFALSRPAVSPPHVKCPRGPAFLALKSCLREKYSPTDWPGDVMPPASCIGSGDNAASTGPHFLALECVS